MKHSSIPVFSEYVNAGATVYTSVEHTALLSRADQLILMAYVDLGSTSSPGTATVQIQHCGDGRNWSAKNTNPEISGALTASQRTVLWGGEPQKPHGSLRFVRLAITQTSSIIARVEVHATVRSFSHVVPDPCKEARPLRAFPAELGIQLDRPVIESLLGPLAPGAMTEILRLAHDHRHLPSEERHRQIDAQLSGEGRRALEGWVRHLRALPHDLKRHIAGNVGMLQGLLAMSPEEQALISTRAGFLKSLLSLVSGEPPHPGPRVARTGNGHAGAGQGECLECGGASKET